MHLIVPGVFAVAKLRVSMEVSKMGLVLFTF